MPTDPQLDPLALAPLSPGETLEPPHPRHREEEPEIDISRVRLAPPEGKACEEAQRDLDPAHVRRLELVSGNLPQPTIPEEGWFQFTLRDLIIVSSCWAVGLGLGRLDPTGGATFLLGWAAVGMSAFVLLSDTKLHGFKVAMFGLLAGYVGALLSAMLKFWGR